MKKIITFILLFMIFSVNVSADENLAFCDRIAKEMPEENYVVSPLSLKATLALTANGAKGETKSELQQVLGIDNLSKYNKLYRDFIAKTDKSKIMSLKIANGIWINKSRLPSAKLKKPFTKIADKYYNATPKTVRDFDARLKINLWTLLKTHGKIRSIIDKSDFDVCLTNAVYFKAIWFSMFELINTKKGEFTGSDGKKSSMDFMNNTVCCQYYSDGNVQIVEMPYRIEETPYKSDEGLDLSMYVILGNCNPEFAIKNCEFELEYVHLSIPKFKTESKMDMKTVLQKAGIKKAFSEDADLMGICGEDMYIKHILHNTSISVTEKGTEAESSTAEKIIYKSGIPDDVMEFIADKPFKYLIRDNKSGEVLFLGSFCKAD